VDSPGFKAPTHKYGTSFGTAPDTSDEDWAGVGYTVTLAPEELEPVPAGE